MTEGGGRNGRVAVLSFPIVTCMRTGAVGKPCSFCRSRGSGNPCLWITRVVSLRKRRVGLGAYETGFPLRACGNDRGRRAERQGGGFVIPDGHLHADARNRKTVLFLSFPRKREPMLVDYQGGVFAKARSRVGAYMSGFPLRACGNDRGRRAERQGGGFVIPDGHLHADGRNRKTVLFLSFPRNLSSRKWRVGTYTLRLIECRGEEQDERELENGFPRPRE